MRINKRDEHFKTINNLSKVAKGYLVQILCDGLGTIYIEETIINKTFAQCNYLIKDIRQTDTDIVQEKNINIEQFDLRVLSSLRKRGLLGPVTQVYPPIIMQRNNTQYPVSKYYSSYRIHYMKFDFIQNLTNAGVIVALTLISLKDGMVPIHLNSIVKKGIIIESNQRTRKR